MRVAAHITPKEVADLLNLKSVKTVLNWEIDQTAPRIDQFVQLSEFCGFDTPRLFQAFIDRGPVNGLEQYPDINMRDYKLQTDLDKQDMSQGTQH